MIFPKRILDKGTGKLLSEADFPLELFYFFPLLEFLPLNKAETLQLSKMKSAVMRDIRIKTTMALTKEQEDTLRDKWPEVYLQINRKNSP